MRISISWLERQIACCLVILLVAPFAEAATAPQAPQPAGAAIAGQGQQQQAAGQSQPPAASPATAANQQSSTPAPVGTAVAPYVAPGGVAASRPAGAAIAPAKQRRIRSFAIRAGLLVGAGIAIGVITAASLGSPNRPH